MPFRIGPTELIIILVIIVIIFGVGKIAGVGGAIGKALHDFRKAQSGEEVIKSVTGEEKDKKQEPAETKTKTEN